MTPYYQDASVTLYCGDCRDVVSTLPAESIDLVVTDPPYGMEWQSGTRTTRFSVLQGDTAQAAPSLIADVTDNLVRVVRRSRHIYSFGIPIDHPLVAIKTELIWDKGMLGSGDLSLPWSRSHEVIHFHVRNADRANVKRKSGILAARLRKGSVLAIPRLNAKQVARHPTEKPVDLLRILIESSSTFNEVVLDPFAGVGSTLVAARREGRKAIGIEIEEKFCAIAKARLSEEG